MSSCLNKTKPYVIEFVKSSTLDFKRRPRGGARSAPIGRDESRHVTRGSSLLVSKTSIRSRRLRYQEARIQLNDEKARGTNELTPSDNSSENTNLIPHNKKFFFLFVQYHPTILKSWET